MPTTSTFVVSSGVTSTNITVSANQIYVVESGGVMSGTTINSGGEVVGDGGILSAGTSLTTNAGVIAGDLTVVGDIDNTGEIGATFDAANTIATMLITGGTLSGSGGVGALATLKNTAAYVEISDEIVSGGTLLAAGNAANSGYAQLSIDNATVSGATLETTGGGLLGVFGGYDSGVTPVSTTIDSATVVKNSIVFDNGVLTFSGGTAQAGVDFWDDGGLLTLSGMSLGNGDLLSAGNSGQLAIDNAVITISAAAVVEATDNSEATLSGGLANAGVIWALASGGRQDMTANVTVSAGGSAVTNAKTGLIEAESLAGYRNSAGVEITGSGAFVNSGGVVAYAQGFGGTAYVSLDGDTVTNAATGAIEALATSDTATGVRVYGIDGLANSGVMMASATLDSEAYLGIAVSGGTISNTKTIEALAPNTGDAELSILDESGSASLVNAKGAAILASANLNGETGLGINVGGSITNSGTIAETLNNRSYGAVNELAAGDSIVNAGTISATAAGDSQFGSFVITAVSSFINSATGTVAFAAQGSGSLVLAAIADGGSIVNRNAIKATATGSAIAVLEVSADTQSGASIANTGTITATATGGSVASLAVEAYGSGAAIGNSKLIEASASGAGSLAIAVLGGVDDATSGAVTVDNTSGTLEAAAAAGGTAYFDIGYHGSSPSGSGGASVSGGTLKTTGADAYLGVFGADVNSAETGSATDVAIAAASKIAAFGFEGNQATLVLSSLVGSIAAGTLVEGAYDGVVDIYSDVTNGGTIEALGGAGPNPGYVGSGAVVISADLNGAVANTGTMVASASDGDLAAFSISAGSVTNAKTMAAIGTGADANFTINVSSYIIPAVLAAGQQFETAGNGEVLNTGLMEAVAITSGVDAFFSISAPVVTNSGTMLVSASAATAFMSIDGGATNAKTVEAFASSAGIASFAVYGDDSDVVANSGTMLASAHQGEATLILDGGTVVNAAGKSMQALGNEAEVSLYINGVGPDGDTGSVTNSGTIAVSGINDSLAVISIDGGSILNAAKGSIRLATSNSDGSLTIFGSSGDITNSGAIVGSASLSAGIAVGIFGGGTITNAASATIELLATSESRDNTLDIIDSAGTAGGIIYNSGTILGSAANSSEINILIANDGGTIVNTKLIEAAATSESTVEASIVGSSIVNSGTIEAIGGPDSDAAIVLGGTVTNSTSGVISASGDGSILLDDGTTIVGGTLRTSGSEAWIGVSGGASGTIASATVTKGTQVFAEQGGTLVLGDGDLISSGALVEADAGGTIVVAGGAVVTNSGTLLAGAGDEGAGTIIISGAVLGSGGVTVGQNGTVDVASGGAANVVFGDNANGTLVVADSAGAVSASIVTVSGFGGIAGEFPGQLIELGGVAYTSGFTASYTLSSADAADPYLDQGTVTVMSGGVDFATIDVVGYYTSSSFSVVSATDGNVAIDDPTELMPPAPSTLATAANTPAPSAGGAAAALLGSYMASLFAAAEGQIGAQAASESQQNQAVLVHPHTG